MKSFSVCFAMALLSACLLVIFSAPPAVAGGSNQPKPEPVKDKRYLVKAVDSGTNSVTIYSTIQNTTQTYRIDEMTTVLLDGSPAKFSDIAAGMEVAQFTERDSDSLDSVNLLSQTSAPKARDPNKPFFTGSDNKIEAVLPDKNSVVILCVQSKVLRTYHIDSLTTVKVNGNSGTFSSIRAGMTVKDYIERDSYDLDSLTLTGT